MAPVLVRPRYGTGMGAGRSSEDVVADGGGEALGESELYSTGELFSPLSKATETIPDVIDLEAGRGEELGDSWFFATPTEETESAVPVVSRKTEIAWVASHSEELAQFEGQWIVVDGQRVVVNGYDFAEVTKDARSKGIEIPYVIKVEIGEVEPVIG